MSVRWMDITDDEDMVAPLGMLIARAGGEVRVPAAEEEIVRLIANDARIFAAVDEATDEIRLRLDVPEGDEVAA